MVEDAFQQVDEPMALDEKTVENVEKAFMVVDGFAIVVIEGYNNGKNEVPIEIEREFEPLGEATSKDGCENNTFNPIALEEAIKPLYTNVKWTKLATIIILMNSCTIHGMSNKFTDELFALLQFHLLFTNNYLPQNDYVVKTLTISLCLDYKIFVLVRKGVSYYEKNFRMLFVVQNVEHLNTRINNIRETKCSC
jgi:hypothetical protein